MKYQMGKGTLRKTHERLYRSIVLRVIYLYQQQTNPLQWKYKAFVFCFFRC